MLFLSLSLSLGLCLLLLVVLKIAILVTPWMEFFSSLSLSVLRSYLLLSQVFSSNHLYSSFLQVVPMTHLSFLSVLFTRFFLFFFSLFLLLVCVSLISFCLTVSHLTNLDSSLEPPAQWERERERERESSVHVTSFPSVTSFMNFNRIHLCCYFFAVYYLLYLETLSELLWGGKGLEERERERERGKSMYSLTFLFFH